jgi:hypothetical protein
MPICIDDDDDEMPDQWETVYFGNTSSNGTGDADNDGIANRYEWLAGTDPTNSASRMRILDLDLAPGSSTNMLVTLVGGDCNGNSAYASAGDRIQRAFIVGAANTTGLARAAVGTIADGLTGTNTWTDTNAVTLSSSRYYALSVELAGAGYTNTEEWAMYVQPRTNSNTYLVSVPVNLGTNNTLGLRLGDQLARGLHGGADCSDTNADVLYHRTTNDMWEMFTLVTNEAGQALWYDQACAPAQLTVTEGMGFWLRRRSATPRYRSDSCVLAGRSFTNSVSLPFSTNGQTGGWTWKIFAWPYATPKTVTSGGVGATSPNQMGFESSAYGGLTGDADRSHADQGDQIWVWQNNTFKYWYWLMRDTMGANYTNRWWSDRAGTFAGFSLEPGKAYFYRHHVATNGATTGTNFLWNLSP